MGCSLIDTSLGYRFNPDQQLYNTSDNFSECISLEVNESQKEFIASNVKSLAEAYVNPTLFPLAIYDAKVAGYEKPELPMVGFIMYEITAGVGFILRLMINRKCSDLQS